MRRAKRMLICAALLIGALSFSACAASFPSAPAHVGDDFPHGGIPVSVAWPSDWLEGFVSESDAVGGSIVGLRLEHIDDRWVWRVRSVDPGRDIWGESVTEPDRGRESLVDARTLAVVRQHHVTLADAELVGGGVSAYDAAQLSGEIYPTPRLIGLERLMDDGRPAWRITTYDTKTGVQSAIIVSDL